LKYLAGALSAAAARLEPKDAAEVAATLTRAMTRTIDSRVLEYLAPRLYAVAPHLEPKDAAADAAALTQAMNKTIPLDTFADLAQGLSALAARMEPKEAGAVCAPSAAVLTRALSERRYYEIGGEFTLVHLAAGLAAVADRLGPKEAAAAAAALARAVKRTNDRDVLVQLAQSLSVVVSRLEPMEAAAAAAAFLRAMRKSTFYGGEGAGSGTRQSLPPLTEGLSAALSRESRGASRRRRASVAGAVVGLSDSPRLLTVSALMQPALEPLPPPLPAQTLVDLLKDPVCVGEAQRLVLDQLARHYDRPFADQWDFARFAEEQRLGLNLTSPPRAPGIPAGPMP
jgi:hypothetical protein